jgi:hypothetical protein
VLSRLMPMAPSALGTDGEKLARVVGSWIGGGSYNQKR